MTKKELEMMVSRLMTEQTALRKHYEKIVRAMKRSLKEQEKRMAAMQDTDEELQELPEPQFTPLERLANLVNSQPSGKPGETPRFADFVARNDIDNLKDINEYLFLALLKRDLGDAVVQRYTERILPRHAFIRIVRFYDNAVDDNELEISAELRTEAEAAQKEAEERALYLKPTAGAFHLRGRGELERFFNDNVVDIVNNHAVYRAVGVDFPQHFILEGAPGCGKTFAVERLAEHLGWNLVRLNAETIGSSLVHGTAKKIEQAFAEAAEKAPSLVIIDEMDAFMPNRSTLSQTNDHSKEEVDSFLQVIQTAAQKHVLVVGMTNLIDTIDPAILRTGRMGTHIKVGMPSLTEVEDVLAYALEKRPHESFPLTPYAEQLLNRPLSDVTAAVNEAAMNTARHRRTVVTEADLAAAIRNIVERTAPKEERRTMGFAA